MESLWEQVDDYFAAHLAFDDAVLADVLADSQVAGLPAIAVTPSQGKLLYLLAQLRGARRILEIGTLGGYSTIWMARALPPDGQLITLEISEAHAAVARRNIGRAGLTEPVQIWVAPAIDSLAKLAEGTPEPFDLVFIDADKANIDRYFAAAVELSRPGSIIVVDNVVRNGEVLNPASSDANIQGVRRFTENLARDPRVAATAIQTVGSKGYDGFVLAVVQGKVG